MAIVAAAAIVTGAAVVQLAQVAGPAVVDVQLLAINDFHGGLEPASDANGRIGPTDAGGVEYLASHLARLKAANPNTFIVSAGDNIGGTPLLSSLSHDEASIEALNLAGLQVSAVGNHELDEGWWELQRMQKGGCHPVDGCQDGTPFAGASFAYLAANITLDPRRADPDVVARAALARTDAQPLFPAYTIKEVDGIRIGFIGVILQEAPNVILPTSIRGLTFGPEAEAANEAARALGEQGVRAIVVLIHEGGEPGTADINGCVNISRDLVDLVNRMSDDIDVVVSGHTHRAYNCTIGRKLVTSASSSGRVITDIDLRIERSGGEVLSKSARNVVVTRDVPKDPGQAALLAHYRPVAEKVGGRVVGTIAGSLTRAASPAGETSIGDVIADALLEAANKIPEGNADVAFWNPGGIRADLVAPAGSAPTAVTYAQLFAVMPFGNELIVKSLTSEALLQVLEEQFGAERTRIMQVSKGLTYAYDESRPLGQRVDRSSVRVNGAPLVPGRRYRVATSNYLWGGGDGLRAVSSGTDPVTVGVDVDVVADYFSRHSPVPQGPRNRIRKIR
jgi:5'-nucleotidase